MRRQLYILLIVVGVVVGAVGITGVATRHTHRVPQYTVTAPSHVTLPLAAGSWNVFVRAGSGPYGTPAQLAQLTVTGPNGANITVVAPATSTTVRVGGRAYADSTAFLTSFRAPTAGSYQLQVSPPSGVASLAVLVTRPAHFRFPWDGVVIDGVVLIVAGTLLTVFETRRRRQVEILEAAYAASARRP